jgi:predicted transcriptional regulator of viral defense system
MKLNAFFVSHPVFTVEELDRFLNSRGAYRPEARQELLQYHSRQSHIERIRRGLYATVPPGKMAGVQSVDPFLIASRLTDDSVLAYHAALTFHGFAHSVREEFTVLTRHGMIRPLAFRGAIYRAVHPARALGAQAMALGVDTRDRQGLDVRVTSLERTLVDVLDRPVLAGGWEEAWQSLESVPFFDLDRVVEYTLLLENATTAARVGYFLEQHQKQLMAANDHLEALRRHRPRQPHYLERSGGPGHLAAGWNLIVPETLADLAEGSGA